MKKEPERRLKTDKVHDIDFEAFYAEISHAWEVKTKDLQARRWRALKQSMKKDRYTAFRHGAAVR